MLKLHGKSNRFVLVLAFLGISCAPQSRESDREAAPSADPPSAHAALASPVAPETAGRKLALLVGIGKYKNIGPRLYGPANDLEAMRSVLRSPAYGFRNEDIHVLPEGRAKRADILEEIEEHLIAKARPGDVVLFYFSGHGAVCSDPGDPTGLDNTLVP